jgi:branched-chain amino acid transport system permease protein
MALRKPSRSFAIEAASTALLGLCALALSRIDGYSEDLAVLSISYALLALGMYAPLVLCGSLSLAYNTYYAIGAYTVAILAARSPALLPLAVVLAAGVSAAIAVFLGAVTARLTGFHLALVTLMFGILIENVLIHADAVTGGPAGLGGIPRLDVFGWSLGRSALIAIGVVIVWVVALALSRLRGSMVGIAMRTLKEVPAAAEASGIALLPVRLICLGLGAAIASFAGVGVALVNGFVQPELFSTSVIFIVLFMPILGGVGSPWGAVLGAVVVVAFTVGFDLFDGPGMLTFGLMTLAVFLVAPSGLLGWLGSLWASLRDLMCGQRRVLRP